MAQSFEADLTPIHIAGGGARITPPPGTVAMPAPRRCARGRSDDLLFMSLRLNQKLSDGREDQLAQLGTQVFFGTPGSVTAALREAAAAINDHLQDLQPAELSSVRVEGHFLAGVLRGESLFLAQSGIGQAILIRPGQVTTFRSEVAETKPLGSSLAPQLHYHHLQVNAEDLLILTTAPPPLWSEPTLSGLAGLSVSQAMDRLIAARSADLTGLLLRITPSGQTTFPEITPAETPSPRRQPARRRPRQVTKPTPSPEDDATLEPKKPGAPFLENLSTRLRPLWGKATQSILQLFYKMAPGLAEPDRSDGYPPLLLGITAAAIPILVVAIASLIYFRRGRQEQFQNYLSQAQAAMVSAEVNPDPLEARSDWAMASQWLELAESYFEDEETQTLRGEIDDAIDRLDLISRVDFQPALSGGFGPQAEIYSLAASATDLYVYDGANDIIWHTWGTGRGYELDREFRCLDGTQSIPGFGKPIDIVIQPEPGALGVEGVVALDEQGNLLYCAPGVAPLTGTLTPPDIGWGNIEDLDVFQETLYVLDNETNAVWLYDAADGLFSGVPALFFAEAVIDLSSVNSIALAQDELILLHQDGHLDRCRRTVDNAPDGSLRIRVECDPEPYFEDEREGYLPSAHIPGALPIDLVYSPPPEPSMFFLDLIGGGVFHYSMRLVYQGQYHPEIAFDEEVTAITYGPPNDIYIAVGEQVYYTQLRR